MIIVAHRGASQDAPENTIPAFELAWQQGADAIEVDVHLTQDGHIVCVHDHDTKRTSDGDMIVRESALAALSVPDFGVHHGEAFKGTSIATMGDVLALVPSAKKVYVEIKCGVEIIPKLLDVLAASGLDAGQVLLISFNAAVLRELKTIAPQYKTSLLCDFYKGENGEVSPSLDDLLQRLSKAGVDALGASSSIPEHFIRAVEARGYEWHVWTVDDPETARRMQALGVASITTNAPGLIRNSLLNSFPAGDRG